MAELNYLIKLPFWEKLGDKEKEFAEKADARFKVGKANAADLFAMLK